MRKRFLAGLLALAMVAAMLPAALAAEPGEAPPQAAAGSPYDGAADTELLTRAVLADEVVRGLELAGSGADAGFQDLDSCTEAQRAAINTLAELGVLRGTGPDTFTPNGEVVRAEAVVVLWRALGCPSNTEDQTVSYPDVAIGDWFAPAIFSFTAMGIVQGTGSGAFDPYGAVSVGELRTLLSRCAGADRTGVTTGGVSRVEMAVEAYEGFRSGPLQAVYELKLAEGFQNPYVDVDACTAEEQAAIGFFTALGVVSGYNPENEADGQLRFYPDAPASNLQIAMFLMRCAQLRQESEAVTYRAAAGDPQQAAIDAAFEFLRSQGLDVAAAWENPNAPALPADLAGWNDGLRPAAPEIAFTGGQAVLTADGGADIRYTTDGTVPTADSPLYTGAISVAANTVVQAVAVENNLLSDTASATAPAQSGSSSGGTAAGGSGSVTSSETVTNPDGSTTTTVTNRRTGAVTETTRYPDGATLVVETAADGTVTTTETDAGGNVIETVENPDGSGVVTVERADGSGSVTALRPDGGADAQATLSAEAVAEAQAAGQPAALPLPALTAADSSDDAPTVAVSLPGDDAVRVEIPLENGTAGTVAVLVGADGTETVLTATVPTASGVAVLLTDGDTVKLVDNGKSFADVSSSHWAAEAIAFATGRELLNGTASDAFTPEGATTRAMLTTILARLDGVDTSGGSLWYEQGMAWAVAAGVSDGTNPEGRLTREQLAVMLWRYAGAPAGSGSLDAFTDGDRVSSYAADGLRWAVGAGILDGVGDGVLAPQGSATRAQVAAILMRFLLIRNG